MSEETPRVLEFGALVGHKDARGELEKALTGARLHHGWMFAGPRGVGKLRAALLFASALLGSHNRLSYAPDARIVQLMQTGAHPDFVYIGRPVDEKGKVKSDIPVDSIRKLSRFFSLRPAMGGWRIAIVDAMDDLNASSANALLKTLEEPPARSLLILISHGEKPVLPTLKSRCRKLRFSPLTEGEALEVLSNSGVGEANARPILSLAPGRPGRALALMEKSAREATTAMQRAVRAKADARSVAVALNTASRSEDAFEAALAVVAGEALQAARDTDDALIAGEWARLHADLQKLGAETRGLNMDKSQAVASALFQFQKQLRAG